MKREIGVLPPEVVDQIAAGEVVERPASVVKELIENALDAGANDIRVRAAGGGITWMEVTDNGTGMDPDGAKLALKRHATSKIRSLRDLETLTSLGFRGEALSSIASVCRLEMFTRAQEALEGVRLVVEGGKVAEQSPWGCPPGTRVRVEELFFNVPARRKFLRSVATEARHIKEAVERVAMAEPGVGFQYQYEGREVLDCPAMNRWGERVRQIWGKELFEGLYPVELAREGLTIEGFLSHPNFHRGAASWIWLYVNGRVVQDRGLLHALMRGYDPLMEKGRYPVGVVQIKIDPKDVDVNVHPTKREVRFRHPQPLHDTMVAVVRRLLREQPWTPGLDHVEPIHEVPLETPVNGRGVAEASPRSPWKPAGLFARRWASPQEPSPPGEEGPVAQDIRFLGQVEEMYLVFTSRSGLLVVDQHAAHERILFERLLDQWGAGGQTQGQGLLWAEVIELTREQGTLLAGLKEILAPLGWVIEPFGGDAWRFRTIPPWMDPGEASDILRDLLDACVDGGLEGTGDDVVHDVLARLACRGAVRGGRRMEAPEARALLKEMRRTPARGLCPHGRPTVVEISLAELHRRFGRS